jgi:hypothetical protein
LRFHARIWIRSTIQMSSYYQSFLPPAPSSSTDPILVFVIVDLQQQHQPWPSHAGAPTNCARSDHHLIRALHLTADLRHQGPLQRSAPLAAHKDPPASFASQPLTTDLSRFAPASPFFFFFCAFCYLVLGFIFYPEGSTLFLCIVYSLSLKEKRRCIVYSLSKSAQIIFGPLLAHYLYLAFAVLFQTKAYFSP